MSHRTMRLAAAVLATVAVVAAPTAVHAHAVGTEVRLACQAGGGGCTG